MDDDTKPLSRVETMILGHQLKILLPVGSLGLVVWTSVARTVGRIDEATWLVGMTLAVVMAVTELWRRQYWRELLAAGRVPELFN